MTNSIAPSEAGTEGEIRKDIKHGKKVEVKIHTTKIKNNSQN